MRDRPKSTPPPSDPVSAFQHVLRTIAGSLRPWGQILHASAEWVGLSPETEEDVDEDAKPFGTWLADFTPGLTLDLARLIAELEALAEVTPETRNAYHADQVADRAARVWREIDPGAPRASRG
jgi:hypothetical protein